jgi:membrane-associated phospholipid phosphatase
MRRVPDTPSPVQRPVQNPVENCMHPAPTSERIWACYLVIVVGIALLTPALPRAGVPWWHLVVHAIVGAFVAWSWWLARRGGQAAARVLRALLAVVGLPVVFSAMSWLLPDVHPEPFEFLCHRIDEALFVDPFVIGALDLPPWFVEVMQLDYAAFYAICIGSALLAGWRSGAAAFDRATLLLVFGFLVSYLGYLVVPTLGPKVVLVYERGLEGLWFTAPVRQAIDAGEANPWDCFPSGHTMMTATALLITFRWHRAAFWWLLLPGLLLVLSTMLLRYHWVADVVAGALLFWPCARCADWLADRDGWPAAATRV